MLKIISVLFIPFCICFDFSIAANVVDVKTSSGTVRGQPIAVLSQTVNQFLGIPYAEPPLGSLRFAKPKPIAKPIGGIIDATKPKHSCIQFDYWSNVPDQSEDCLVLNIWSQNRAQNQSLKAVMFWIYGGGLSAGTIFNTMYDGVVLAAQDVVVVTTNYRLGPLGFLYSGEESAPGNVGFYDQLLALKWVRENIHLFGGDKNQITIFGESAGSWSVSALLLSPLSNGMFKRAIMQSAAYLYNKDRPIITKEEALLEAKQLAKSVNCSDDNHWLECLRKVDINHIRPINTGLTFPVDGTECLPLSAQKAFNENKFNKDLDLMAGVTKDEGSILAPVISTEIYTKNLTKEDFTKFVVESNALFHNLNAENLTKYYLNNVNTNDSNAIKWKIFDFFGDVLIKCPTYLFAKWYAIHSNADTNVFFYELTHSMSGLQYEQLYGVAHSADIPFIFGLVLLNPKSTTTENLEMSKDMVKMWTNFAKTGKPHPNWPKLIDTKSNNSMTFVRDLKPGTDEYLLNLYTKNCEGIWKDYF